MTQNLLEEVGRAFGRRPVLGSLAYRCASGGPLGACGRAGLHIPGQGGERGGRPCEQLAALAPSARSWGRSLARSPALSQSLAFCAATFPEPFEKPAPAPLCCPRQVCVSWVHPVGTAQGSEDSACLGDSLAVASPEEGGYVRTSRGRPVSAQRPRRAHVGSGRRQPTPRTLAARQSRARRGCKTPFSFPKRDLCRI